jgi:hypothetical protein
VEADPQIAGVTFAPLSGCATLPVGIALPAGVPPVTEDMHRAPRAGSPVPGALLPAAAGASVALPRLSAAVAAMQPFWSLPAALPDPVPAVTWPMTCGGWQQRCDGTWDMYVPRTVIVDPVTGVDACPESSSAPLHPRCGTQGTPFRTVAYAMARVWPGDTIQLRQGVHAGCFAVYMANVTLESFPGEWAVVEAPIHDPACSSAIRIVPWGNAWMDASDVTIRRLEVRGGYHYALFNNQVTARGSYWTRYMRSRGLQPRGFTLVEDAVLHRSGTSVVKLSPQADHMVFRRVEVAWSGMRGQPPCE